MWKSVGWCCPKAEYLQNEYHVKWVLHVKFIVYYFIMICIIGRTFLHLCNYHVCNGLFSVCIHLFSSHFWRMSDDILLHFYYKMQYYFCENLLPYFWDDWLHYSTHERIPSSVSVSNGGCIFFSSVLNNCESLPSFAWYLSHAIFKKKEL